MGLNTRDSEFITGQGDFYDQMGTGGDGDYAEKEEILNDDRDTMQNMAGQERGGVRYATDSTCQNSIFLVKGNKTITCKSNSPEVFRTPRGSPEPSTTSSPLPEEHGQSVSSGNCDHCFKLRRTLSKLYKKLKELEQRGEVERISNHQQITAYKKELNNITLENYAASSKYHERHLEQKKIIFQLSTTIDNIFRRQEESEKVSQLTMELEKVKIEKEREREEKYREKADKERERREKDQEREEKWKEREEREKEREEEREEKERVKKENAEIKRRNTELEMKIQQMYAQYHRASSLQCSSEDGTWPDDDVEVGEGERRDDRVPPFHPETSDTLSTYMPPPRQANTNYTTAVTTTNYTTTPGPTMDPRDYHSTSTALQSNTNAGGDYTTTNTTIRGPQGNANNGDYYVPPTGPRGPTSSHSHSRSTAHHHQQQQLPPRSAYNHHSLHPAAAQQHARDNASTNSMDFNRRHKMH